MEKGQIAKNEQFHPCPQCFLCKLYLKNPLTATFQLLSASSSNLGHLKSGVLGNGLTFNQTAKY